MMLSLFLAIFVENKLHSDNYEQARCRSFALFL